MPTNKVLDLRLQNESIPYSADIMIQRSTFYEELQNSERLDLRDNRGKRHNMPFVLLGVAISLLRKRDGTLSSIHRSIRNKHEEFCAFLGLTDQPIISRSHLPILLSKVNLKEFESLLFKHYQFNLDTQQQSWFATDGKELRGSITKGSKRGEVLVQVVEQETREVIAQSYYSGKKESEKTCVQELLADQHLLDQQITADALHLSPAMTVPIQEAGGKYLIGLKKNQRALYQDMVSTSDYLPIVQLANTVEKGHGRSDSRMYIHYDISKCDFDKRWNKSGFRSLFKVNRESMELDTGKTRSEVSYYISNVEPNQEQDYFRVIRKHWSVEVNNHIRDVTLDEDSLRTKKTMSQK